MPPPEGGNLPPVADLETVAPPSTATDLASRLSRTLAPSQICAAAKELYGALPKPCEGVPTTDVKKVKSVPVKTGPTDQADANNDGTVDALDGPDVQDVKPLTSGVEVGGVGRLVAGVVAGVAAASVLLV